MQPGNIELFFIGAIGFGRIPFNLTIKSYNLFYQFSQFPDRQVLAGADVEERDEVMR